MKFQVCYQLHKYTDMSDNPAPRTWTITADSPEQAFEIAQRRAIEQRTQGRKVGHVYREMYCEDGSIVTAEGDYLLAHELIVKCLHDAQAECSCGRWSYIATGERTREHIEEQFNFHLEAENA